MDTPWAWIDLSGAGEDAGACSEVTPESPLAGSPPAKRQRPAGEEPRGFPALAAGAVGAIDVEAEDTASVGTPGATSRRWRPLQRPPTSLDDVAVFPAASSSTAPRLACGPQSTRPAVAKRTHPLALLAFGFCGMTEPLPRDCHTKEAAVKVDRPVEESQGVQRRRPLRRSALTLQAPPSGMVGNAIFTEPCDAFLRHLQDHGYAILNGILRVEVEKRRFLENFWAAMSSILPTMDPQRRDTWNFPKGFRGIVSTYGLPQADFAWMARASPRMRLAFSRIFDTQDLVVSLDAVIAEEGIPRSVLPPWLHKDQRFENAGLSIQAVYSFFESGPQDAGTCVVPGSHKVVYDWEHSVRREHLRAPPDSGLRAVKPDVPPDSAVFFNSRLVHASVCGKVIRGPDPATKLPLPCRLGVCVAYAPRHRRSQETRVRKESAYLEGKCSSHWPCDNFSLKPPPRYFQNIPGAVRLPRPPADPERLALL